MRVLHIITCLDTGGAEASLYKLIKYFDDERFEHFVCSLNGRGAFGGKLEALGSRVFAFNGRPLSLAWSVPRLVSRVRPDIVHGWMQRGNLAASWSRSLGASRAPVLWNVRQSLYDIHTEPPGTAILIRAQKALSRLPCRIIYNSHLSARQHGSFGFCDRKISVIPNGFDTDIFKPNAEARRSIRREIGIKDDTPLIGLIGRYHPMKDHANFLNAARLVRASRPEAVFLLAGRDTRKLLQSPAATGLEGSLKILDERQDIPEITAALDIAGLSSFTESFPNVIGEAMACGIPCVATDVGDARRIIGDTGYIVPPRDSQALASGMISLLDRPDRQQMGAHARQRIVTEFSVAASAAMYRDLYRELLGR